MTIESAVARSASDFLARAWILTAGTPVAVPALDIAFPVDSAHPPAAVGTSDVYRLAMRLLQDAERIVTQPCAVVVPPRVPEVSPDATTPSRASPPVEPAHAPDTRPLAEELLRRARDAVARAAAVALPQRRAQATSLLSRFAGFPRRVYALRVWGIDRQESSAQAVLSWLLTPTEDHGLGDLFARHFLARIGLTLRGRVFDLRSKLPIGVIKEFQWEMPPGSLSRGTAADREENESLSDYEMPEPDKYLRVDILMSVADALVPIEVKWDADEWVYFLTVGGAHREPMFQAQLYGRVLDLAVAAHRRRAQHTRPVSTSILPSANPGSLLDFYGPVRAALTKRLGREEASQWLACGRVVGVLVGAKRSSVLRYGPTDQPARGSSDAGPGVRTLNWFDIAEIAQELLTSDSMPPDTADILHNLREAIYRHFGREELARAVRSLRLRLAAPGVAGRIAERAATDIAEHLDVLERCIGLDAHPPMPGEQHRPPSGRRED